MAINEPFPLAKSFATKNLDKCRKSNNRSVLFVASFADCPRAWKMASTLAENDFHVTMLEWDRNPNCPTTPYSEGVAVKKMKLKAPYGQKAFFKMILWWAYVSTYVFFHGFTFVQPQNLDNLLPVWIASRLKKTKIVYDVADFYADSFLPAKMSTLRRVIAWLERVLIKTVDSTIIVDESRSKQINMAVNQVWTIYNSPPQDNAEEHKTPIERNSKFLLLYAGIISKDRGLVYLVNAVKGLEDVELVVAGFGEMEDKFSEMIEGISNIKFLGKIPYTEVLKLTNSCDCVIALYDPITPNNIYASPNKLFEGMMFGKPIIVNSETAMASLVAKEHCGLTVRFGDVLELRNAINLIKNNRALATSIGANGRNSFTRKFSWSLMSKKLLKLYNSMPSICDNNSKEQLHVNSEQDFS